MSRVRGVVRHAIESEVEVLHARIKHLEVALALAQADKLRSASSSESSSPVQTKCLGCISLLEERDRGTIVDDGLNGLSALIETEHEKRQSVEEEALSLRRENSLANREIALWYHKHVRCAGALGAHLCAMSFTPKVPVLMPLADCVDALLRVMVLGVSGGTNNNLICLSARKGTHALKLVHEMNPKHEPGDSAEKLGDPRSIAYVQVRGRQAVAILEDKFKQIRIVSVFDWSKTLTTVPLPDKGLVHSVVALEDRSMVAVSNCTSAKSVFIIDLETAECVRTINIHVDRVKRWWPTGLCLLPDGLLAVADYNGGIEILDPNTGRSARTIHLDRGSVPNGFTNDRERPARYELLNASASTPAEKRTIRPSRLAVLPRVAKPATGDTPSVIEYDILVLDDDYSKCIMRFSYPDFQPVGAARGGGTKIKHLYGAECGGIWPLPEHGGAAPFHERLAVLDHSSGGGKVSIIDVGDSDGVPLCATPDTMKRTVFRSALGMTMIPAPDAVIE